MWQAVDQEFSLNYRLLQLYILNVLSPGAGVPSLADHRVAICSIMSSIVCAYASYVYHHIFCGSEVAFIHVSCCYNLHPEVRKRGGKTQVKVGCLKCCYTLDVSTCTM